MSPRSLPLSALLSIVPYFHARGAVRVTEAARDLGVTERQLRDALWQLWSCGLPGYGPGDLIDLGFSTEDLDEADLVEVTFTAGIDRPVRLTAAEAVTLETGLAVFLDQPGAVDQQSLRELMALLREAAGQRPNTATGEPDRTQPGEADVVREAVGRGLALRFGYHSASSDTSSTRVVDPSRVYVSAGHTYLVGVDRSTGSWRTFRTDRMRAVETMGPRRELGPENPRDDHAPEGVETAVVPRGAEWFLDEFDFRDRCPGPAGSTRVSIAYHDRAWLERFLLGHADVVVPDDPRLRTLLAERARAGLAGYEQR